MAKTRFGIIGFGETGKLYGAAIEQSADADIVATSGPNGDHGRWMHFEDASGLLGRSDVDAVIVACPSADVTSVIAKALEQGTHVLCARPPGCSNDDAAAICAADAASKAVLQFAMPLPAHGSVMKAKSLLDEGSFGAVRSIRAVYGCGGRRGIAEDAWKLDPDKAGGGVLMDDGYHLIDLVSRLGGPIIEADGVISGPHGMEDNAVGVLRFASGAVGQIHVSATQWRATFRVEIGLDRGYLWLDGLLPGDSGFAPEMLISARVKTDEAGVPLPNPPEEVRAFDDDKAIPRVLGAFLRTVDDVAPSPASATAEAALAAMDVVQRLYRD